MLSAEEARQLDGLAFGATIASPAATASGTRVARVRGLGAEFHDFRHYQPGDDPRSIEWTVYGRLGQLVTRTYRADAQLRVHLMVDISRSMNIGLPDKLSCARKLAALLCYVAVCERDAVGVATFDDRIAQRVAPAAGRPQLFRVLGALGAASSRGSSAIGRALMDYGSVERGPGLVVVISDFFDSVGVLQGLRYLMHRGLTPAVAHILSPDDLDPSISGSTELVDIEAPETAPLLVDADTVTAYTTELTALRASLGEFCATHGLPWMQLSSSDSFRGLLQACQRAGVLTGQG